MGIWATDHKPVLQFLLSRLGVLVLIVRLHLAEPAVAIPRLRIVRLHKQPEYAVP